MSIPGAPPGRSCSHLELLDVQTLDPGPEQPWPSEPLMATQGSPMLGEDVPQTPHKRPHDDSPYNPHSLQSRIPGVTSRRREKTASSLPTQIKSNVNRAVAVVRRDPDAAAICVVSGVRDAMAIIQYSHIASAATPLADMDRIEWSWNMSWCTLNLDTWKNLQSLSITLHHWYDKTENSRPTGWFWLPDQSAVHTLRKMHKFYVGDVAGETTNARKDPNSFYPNNPKFLYRFVPLPGMRNSWDVRLLEDNIPDIHNDRNIAQYWYPFDELPPYELYIPYHFVILNTGKKLHQLYGIGPIDMSQFSFLYHPLLQEVLSLVRNIYVAWTTSEPSESWLSGTTSDGEKGRLPDTAKHEGGARPSRHENRGHSDHQDGGQEAQHNTSAGHSRIRRAAGPESLAPSDSMSCLEVVETEDVQDLHEAFVDDEDEEWEDDEFFAGLQLWADRVWAATFADRPTDSEVTAPEDTKEHFPSKYLNTTAPPSLPFLSV